MQQQGDSSYNTVVRAQNQGLSGEEAADIGLVNRAFAPDDLEQSVLEVAKGIAQTSPAVVAVNKRYVHTAMEARGSRSVIRTGGDLQAGPHLAALGDATELTQRVKESASKD